LTLLSSIGHISVERRYMACSACKNKRIAWDDWAGLDTRRLSPEARRMASLAGMSWSFDIASKRLAELCHIQISDDTIERVCQEEGQRAKGWISQSPEPARVLRKAAGQAEFYTDGVKINTTGGWREMRLSVLAKRPPARPAKPSQWKERVLEEPTARLAICAIAPAHVVGSSWKHLMNRLGLGPDTALSVIGDGAKWIWIEAAKRFGPNSQWIVDVFHVSEHIHDCGKAIFGEGSAARQWADEQLDRLIEMEGPRYTRELEAQIAAAQTTARQEAMKKLLCYLRENLDRLWYASRLLQGLPIGSGLIEGACKNTLGARLKINSARWRIRRAERIGALRCLDYSGQWDAFWQKSAA